MTYADRAAETNGPIYLSACLRKPRVVTDSCRPRRKLSYGNMSLGLGSGGHQHKA